MVRSKYQIILHQLGELGALILVVPFLLTLLNRYKFKRLDKIGIWLIIIVTLIIDGYLLMSWFSVKESFKNDRNNMIKKLVRQISRWSVASRQDKNNLIAVLHANYGAGYLYAMQTLFSDKEIEKVLGSEEIRKQLEEKVIEIQDKATKKAVKDCPNYAGTMDFLAKLGGEA